MKKKKKKKKKKTTVRSVPDGSDKKLSFLIKIADFVNISIWEGKKRVISANVIDHMFMFMFIAVKIFDIAMCLVVICTVFFLRLSFKIEFFIKCA